MKIFQKNNILIARFSSIGDVVLTTPILRALKEQLPNSQITYLSSMPMASILENNPFIDKIFLFNKNDSKKEIQSLKNQILEFNSNQPYDLVVDLQNNLRSKLMLSGLFKKKLKFNKNRLYKLALVHFKYFTKEPQHVVERYFDTLKPLKIVNKNYKPEIFINTELQSNKNEIIIGIAHGANHLTKQWLPEYYATLINLLSDKYNAIFYLFGNSREAENATKIFDLAKAKIIDYTGKLSLKETICKISQCDYFISNDTGLMHIASALRIPIIAIFGSTVPELGFAPYGIPYRIAQIELGCRPCTHIGRNRCPRKHFDCMRRLTPTDVFTQFEHLLNAIKKKN
jgi:heptosyltransferase-2